MARLSDRGVIVTGAAGGIGAVFARTLAAAGARASVCDLRAPDATVAAIREAGGEAIGTVCDVTDAASVARLVAETE
jgi:NAD(P)-dependent dehydrogenase (short-subunit alcohol dehydrogenase family)